ncbi:MAG: hypothetical protein JSR33_09155 [Proteobacteria bacterium]|nr:hypothetical protein [Pseudomonadota bacterium]
MKKEIFSWAALENCGYRLKELKTTIKCCRCGKEIKDAGFLGYVPVNRAEAVHWTKEIRHEQKLIRNYQFSHVDCDS